MGESRFQIVSEEPMLGGTRVHLDLAGRWGFVTLPPREQRTGKWVWYAPTLKNVYPHATLDFYTARLLEAGIGFAGMDVGEAYGSPAGTRLFEAFHAFVSGEFALSPRVTLLPQSRGGLLLYNWATRHPQNVERIAGIYPVCDVRLWPGLTKAAAEYNMSEAQLAAEVARYNPIDLLEPLAKSGVPILHLHGDSDAVVPIDPHSGELARRYRALGGKMELAALAGTGHGLGDELFKSERFAGFLIGEGGKHPSAARV
jgi:alpha-beta hydrolase superfamily lysophospholipase